MLSTSLGFRAIKPCVKCEWELGLGSLGEIHPISAIALSRAVPWAGSVGWALWDALGMAETHRQSSLKLGSLKCHRFGSDLVLSWNILNQKGSTKIIEFRSWLCTDPNNPTLCLGTLSSLSFGRLQTWAFVEQEEVRRCKCRFHSEANQRNELLPLSVVFFLPSQIPQSTHKSIKTNPEATLWQKIKGSRWKKPSYS